MVQGTGPSEHTALLASNRAMASPHLVHRVRTHPLTPAHPDPLAAPRWEAKDPETGPVEDTGAEAVLFEAPSVLLPVQAPPDDLQKGPYPHPTGWGRVVVVLGRLFPVVGVLGGYSVRRDLWHDTVAGLSVAIMAVPQALSYAHLAGLPAQHGLYAALLPPATYALLGGCRQLAVGPVAVVSLLVAQGLAGLHVPAPAATDTVPGPYVQLAVLLALVVGLLQVAAGLLGLGRVVALVPHPVVLGFTHGAVLTISLAQVPLLLGLRGVHGHDVPGLVFGLWQQRTGVHWLTVGLSCAWLGLLLGLRWLGTIRPAMQGLRTVGPLVLATVATTVTWAMQLQERGVQVVGHVPAGLPPWSLGWGFSDAGQYGWLGLIGVALSVALASLVESLAIGRALAAGHGHELWAGQELVAVGVANVLAGCVAAYPVAGSFSRSSVCHEAGGISQVAGLVASLAVLLVVGVATGPVEYLPTCSLAAIILVGLAGVADPKAPYRLWREGVEMFGLWMVAVGGTLILGTTMGLLVACGAAVLVAVGHRVWDRVNGHEGGGVHEVE